MSDYRFIPDRSINSYKKSDIGFIVAVILMWGIGLFTLFVCSSVNAQKVFGDSLYFFKRQLIASAIGFAGLLFFAICPLKTLRKILPVLVFITLILCLLTFVPGIRYERNGARRWIKLPFFTFQPSELVKFILVLFLANYFDKYARKNESGEYKTVGPAVAVFSFFAILVFAQKDFSTGLFIIAFGVILMFIANANMFWLLPFSIIGIPSLALLVLTEEYRLNRIAAHFNPAEYAQTFGFQGLAAKRAIKIGGFWGQGIGEGLEKFGSIPEVQSDYIFAGWVEAMGFVGVLIYFALLLFFVYKGVRIALKCPDRFSAFGTIGCVLVIFLQSIMNITVVVGVAPTTGITLPFFSSGGSSIIITLCMCGFIINASCCDSDTLYSEQKEVPLSENDFTTLDMSFFN